MRHDVYVVRLRPVRNLQRLRQPAHYAQVYARVADEFLFDHLAEGPLARPLLSRRNRQRHMARQRAITRSILRSQRIFDEERAIWFQRLAKLDGVRRVQPRMHIEAKLYVGSDSIAHQRHLLFRDTHRLYRLQQSVHPLVLEDASRLRLSPAHELPAIRNRPLAVLHKFFCRAPLRMWIRHHLVAHRPAQQLIDRHLQCLALNVPQCNVYRANGAAIHLVRRKEPAAKHVLPQPFRAERVLPDYKLGQVLNRACDRISPSRYPDFAQPIDAFVRLHFRDKIQLPLIIRASVALDARNLHYHKPP